MEKERRLKLAYEFSQRCARDMYGFMVREREQRSITISINHSRPSVSGRDRVGIYVRAGAIFICTCRYLIYIHMSLLGMRTVFR